VGSAATPSSSARRSSIETVLGIESTAHTFGVGIVHIHKPYILADVRYQYKPREGGILPREVAEFFSRHAGLAVREALEQAGASMRDIDAIAVALGPGMGPALRVGATVARALSSLYGKPLYPVNHGVAHIEIARFLTGLRDPVALYVSGGTTTVASYRDGRYRVFGETLDIALGNFLDTLARELGIAPPYVVEGEHAIDKCARDGNFIDGLPYVVKGQDVSFSGLLTAALRIARKGRARLADICYTVREIAFSSVIEVTERGVAHLEKRQVIVTGGVAANDTLNWKAEVMARMQDARFQRLPKKYTGDNGVMIALTGLLAARHGGRPVRPDQAIIRQRWRLDRVETPWFPSTLGE